MPLRAEWKGQDVFAFDFGEEEWEAFRQEVQSGAETLQMPCCGERACLRVSPRGLPHFYHYRRGDCEEAVGESAEHLLLKQRIIEACRNAGYDVASEVGGDGFVADVMVELPGDTEWRVAFEVQLSSQTREELLERHNRRAAAKVRTCWLSARSLGLPRNGKTVPGFELAFEEDEDEILGAVEVGFVQGKADWGRRPLREFVVDLLDGQLTWKATCRKTPKGRITFFRFGCGQCETEAFAFYYRRAPGGQCECRHKVVFPGTQPIFPWEERFENRWLEWILDWSNRLNLPTKVKRRRDGELVFACPNCNSAFSQRKVWKASVTVYYANTDSKEFQYPTVEWCGFVKEATYPHWCHAGQSGRAERTLMAEERGTGLADGTNP